MTKLIVFLAGPFPKFLTISDMFSSPLWGNIVSAEHFNIYCLRLSRFVQE